MDKKLNVTDFETNNILSQNEIAMIIYSLVFSRGIKEKEVREEEMIRVLDWAEDARRQYMFLDNILNGDMIIDIQDNNIVFGSVSVQQAEEDLKKALKRIKDDPELKQEGE
jgi:hypothetical protein